MPGESPSTVVTGAVMIQQPISIARNTFVESIRQPIYVVLLLLGGVSLVLNQSLAAYTLSDDNKMLVDMGLSTLFLVGLLLAIFTASGVLNREVENKTVLTVISKPVSRPLFIVGKFLGVATALSVAYWVLMLVFLLTVRHKVMQRASDAFDGPVIIFGVLALVLALIGAATSNYLYRRVFTSTFVGAFAVLLTLAMVMVLFIDKQWRFQSPFVDLDPQLLIALLFVFEAVIVLAAIAIACSTRLGQVMTLVICTVVFVLGLVGHFFAAESAKALANAEGSIGHQLVYAVAHVIKLVMPNLQYLWQADALSMGHPISSGHVLLVSLYGGLYALAALALAVALFQTREVG